MDMYVPVNYIATDAYSLGRFKFAFIVILFFYILNNYDDVNSNGCANSRYKNQQIKCAINCKKIHNIICK